MNRWPQVKLNELVQPVDRAQAVKPEGEYGLLGVRLEGRGPFLREAVTGVQTSASKLSRVATGDFIYSRLFAWRGAFGIIDEELDGCFVSNEFPLFRVDDAHLDVNYLNMWFQQPAVWRRVEKDCTGSTPLTRNRFKEKYFLNLAIPLPSLATQRAIIVRLHSLTGKTRQLFAHLDAIDTIAESFVLSTHHKLSNGKTVALSELLELHEDREPVELGEEYPQVGVRSFGGGLFPKAAVTAFDTSYRTFNKLYHDAIVLSQVKGWEGAIALTPPTLVGRFASPEYRTFRCIPKKSSPEYLATLFKTPWFWTLLQRATRGVGARRERTRPEQFLDLTLPMPTFADQCRAADAFAHITKLRLHCATQRDEGAAILPAAINRLFGESACSTA